MKIAVGLSGGVDSAAALALLKKQGHDVVAIMMTLWDGEYKFTGKHACFGPDEKDEIESARSIAEMLEVPFYPIDLSGEYKKTILTYVRDEYISGRTPNPCVKCNHEMKFDLLPAQARKQGLEFDFFATGHYAGISYNPENSRYAVLRGKDIRKDQSYFLYRLTQEQLAGTMFPLAGMTKEQVRKFASSINLPAAEAPESQDFYAGDMIDIIGEEKPGDITDRHGLILGRHCGLSRYTIGQRKGIGISGKAPLYVTAIDSKKNTIIVGSQEEIFKKNFIIGNIVWSGIEEIDSPVNVSVKVRSSGREYAAILNPRNEMNNCMISADEGILSVTPGQSAVCYIGDMLVCGGIIV